jgi:hypothetical protein
MVVCRKSSISAIDCPEHELLTELTDALGPVGVVDEIEEEATTLKESPVAVATPSDSPPHHLFSNSPPPLQLTTFAHR